MFYNNKEQFNIKNSWDVQSKPPKPKQDSDAIDSHVANIVLKDLGMQAKNDKYDAVEQLLNQHKMREYSPKPTREKSPIRSPNKGSLNESVVARLAKVEKLCYNQRLELKEKTEQISQLKDKLSEASRLTTPEDVTKELTSLKEQNLKYLAQINDMERFLLKYGIKWVGVENEDQHKKMQQLAADVGQPKPYFNYRLPKEISIDVIKRRVDELNYIIEKEGANRIVKNANGMHQFQKLDPLPIGFYKNGIALKGFKFFAYGSNDAYQILADILDGYFPYQLKQQFPNGTLLKVIDSTEQLYETDKAKNADYESLDERQLKPQTKDEFLKNLPQHVIKNGKAIPIRSEIEKIFKPQGDDRHCKLGCRKDPVDGSWIVNTQAQNMLDNGQDVENVCTLKFRTETGKYTIIALMFNNQTIKDIYDTVAQLREVPDKPISIILNFPRTVFLPNDMTSLEDAGLSPSAQLFFISS